MPDLLTIEDAAERLHVSSRTIRRLIASGDLPAYRIGERIVRIDGAELANLLKPA